MVGLVILGVLIVFAMISVAYGVDSREESSDPRGPVYPIAIR
jgi:type II secretory pathway pseudopilin PulG